MNTTIISILSGLGGMFGWGISDFLANDASEKIGHTKAFFWSQVAGFLLIAAYFFLVQPQVSFTPLLLALTIFSGIMYAIGYLFFYQGFEIGNVSIVSAVVNFYAVFMVLVSIFIRGQRLTPMQIPAIILITIGVTLVSINFSHLKSGTVSLLKGAKEAFIAAILFGIFYWPINGYIVERVQWSAVDLLTKGSGIGLLFLWTLVKRESLKIKSKKIMPLVAVVGILEGLAVMSITYGLSVGQGTIIIPISSALTLVTIGLAMIFLKEKLTKTQRIGVGMTVIGIILTAF